jgi:hypothetical protein
VNIYRLFRGFFFLFFHIEDKSAIEGFEDEGASYYGPTNALVCIKTLIQTSHTKTFKITSTCFDHQMMIIIIRELSDPG